MTKICLTSVRSLGCTFLDWSVHFLSGQNEFYNVNEKSWRPLTQSPLTLSTAHGHLKNHPSGYDNFKNQIEQFNHLDDNRVYSVYAFPLHVDTAASKLGLDINQIGNNYNKICEFIDEDYNKIIKSCQELNVKLIVVERTANASLYFVNQRIPKQRWLSKINRPENETKANQIIENIFYKDSLETWSNLNLSNVWDERERRALNLRLYPNENISIKNLYHPHVWIACQDLWTRGEDVISKVMSYLDLEIASSRIKPWREIYKQWQKIQLDCLEFSYNCEHIVESIINNWYYEIDLTFEQEVVIQHLLIYQHNLNLKTWNLTKFPSNTQALYELLEPNIHKLTSY